MLKKLLRWALLKIDNRLSPCDFSLREGDMATTRGGQTVEIVAISWALRAAAVRAYMGSTVCDLQVVPVAGMKRFGRWTV